MEFSPLMLFKNSEDVKRFPPGGIIFKAGDPGDFMYLVQEGSVNLMIGDKVLETVEKGGLFGEMALADTGPRSAAAVAKTDCTLAPVDVKKFNFLVKQTPAFAQHVIQLLVRRIRAMNQALKG